MLAITHPPVLPSAMLNDVGTPVAIISQLNTLPALSPVNASMATLRLTTHDSGPGWLAMPFLHDSFIHNSTPVLSRRTQQPARRPTGGGIARPWRAQRVAMLIRLGYEIELELSIPVTVIAVLNVHPLEAKT